MRGPFLPVALRVLGVLFAVFVIWLLRPVWVPGQMMLYVFVGQAAALYAFIGFQSAIGPMPAIAPVSEPTSAEDDSTRED